MAEFREFVHNSNLALPADFQLWGYKEFVCNWATALPDAQAIQQIPMKQLVSTLLRLYHLDNVRQFADKLGPAWASKLLLELPKVDSILSIKENMLGVGSKDLDGSLAHRPHIVKVDRQHGRYVDEHFPMSPEVAWG